MDGFDIARIGQQPPAYMRLTTLARRLGLTVEMIEAEVRAGRMPLVIVSFGQGRIRHVRTLEALRVLQAAETTHAHP